MRNLGILVLGVVAGCGGGATAGGGKGGPAPAPAADLTAALDAEVGAGLPVAILPGPQGLRAISADGARQRVLAPGPVTWAIVDARAEVVWFGADASTIQLIDLRGPAAATPAVEPIVTGLPVDVEPGPPFITVRYPDAKDPLVAGEEIALGHPLYPHAVLVIAEEPALGADAPILEMWDQLEEYDARVRQATIVGRARVAELARRGRDRSIAIARPADTGQRVEGLDTEACDDEQICGTAEAVVGTPLWRVVTAYSCGDGCYATYKLYDPGTKTFREDEWATALQDAWVARDATAFVSDGRIVRFDSGPLPATPAVEGVIGGGWLGGAYYYGF